jgi:hypothetical protein
MDSYAPTLAAQGESGGAASARATAEVCRFFVGRALQLLREVVRDVFGGRTLPIPDAEAAALADQVGHPSWTTALSTAIPYYPSSLTRRRGRRPRGPGGGRADEPWISSQAPACSASFSPSLSGRSPRGPGGSRADDARLLHS